MRCIYCNSNDSKVVDSRPTEDGTAIRRRRECIACGRRFTTYEKVETPMLLVVKKDGQRENYDSDKIRRGLIKACEKRPVTAEQIAGIITEIERKIFNSLDHEVSSTVIGELLMEELRKVDQVAYVRFASVYREFRDIDSFLKELEKLIKE